MWDGKRYNCLAHRLVYHHFKGPIPEGLTINHDNGKKHDNRPSNLLLATKSEQTLHAIHVLGTQVVRRGTDSPTAKLTWKQVNNIRKRRSTGETLASIASDFGVCMQTISTICSGKSWATVEAVK